MSRRLLAGLCLMALALAPVAGRAAPVCEGEQADPPFDAAKAWTEAQELLHTDYAYWDRIDAPAAMAAATPSMLAAPDRLAFADRLQTLLLLYRDSHLHVTPTSKPNAAWVPSAADFWLEDKDGRLVVRDVKGASAAAAMGIRPGWELVLLDGKDPRAEARARFAAIGITPDEAQVLYAINSAASGLLDTPRRVRFRVGGKLRDLVLPPGYDSVKRPDEPVTATTRRDALGHPVTILRIDNALGDRKLIAAFDAAVAALPPGGHVVLDMRDTPSGGDTTEARAIIGHFIETPQPYQRHELTGERVVYGVPRIWVEYVQPRAPYAGTPIVLAGLWTGSMGEGLVIGLDAAAHAPVVGSEMGHLLGAMTHEHLDASCLSISFADEKLWHVDGRPRELYLPPTLMRGADTAADGSDPALASALAMIDAQDGARDGARNGGRTRP